MFLECILAGDVIIRFFNSRLKFVCLIIRKIEVIRSLYLLFADLFIGEAVFNQGCRHILIGIRLPIISPSQPPVLLLVIVVQINLYLAGQIRQVLDRIKFQGLLVSHGEQIRISFISFEFQVNFFLNVQCRQIIFHFQGGFSPGVKAVAGGIIRLFIQSQNRLSVV